MWSLIARIWQAGVAAEPAGRLLEPAPPAFRGAPVVDPARCCGSQACVAACPARALSWTAGATGGAPAAWTLDLGRCQFCGLCAEVCPEGAITQTQAYALATRSAAGLRVATAVGEGGKSDA